MCSWGIRAVLEFSIWDAARWHFTPQNQLIAGMRIERGKLLHLPHENHQKTGRKIGESETPLISIPITFFA